MFKRIVILVSSGFATVALAQAPASPPPAATPAGQPKHNCVKPEEPSRLGTKNQFKFFDGQSKKYRECLQDFVKAQAELVKLHSDDGNSAVKEFNDYVTEMNKQKADSEATK